MSSRQSLGTRWFTDVVLTRDTCFFEPTGVLVRDGVCYSFAEHHFIVVRFPMMRRGNQVKDIVIVLKPLRDGCYLLVRQGDFLFVAH
jgi:hypothetical protein